MEFDFTKAQLAKIIAGNKHIDEWYAALTDTQLYDDDTEAPSVLDDYEITTPIRVAAFLAQCAHESANFTTITENLNYKWESLRRVFPKYFPTDNLAQQYAHQPAKIANRVYANRMGNRDESSGDGWAYCGRGLIQLTGKNNYSKFADSIGMSLSDTVDHLQTFEGAADSAGWFWYSNGLNALADKNDIVGMTKRINGGTNGLAERTNLFQLAKTILSA